MRIIIRLANFVLFVVYLVLICFFNLVNLWFSLALYFLSIRLLIKSFALKQDSSLFLGAILFYLSILGAIKQFFALSFSDIYIAYVFVIGFASMCVYLFFRQNIHLKVVAISILEVILLSIFKLSLLPKYEFIFLQCLFVLFVIANCLAKGYYNSRST